MRHDATYKAAFSHPRMVRDLLRLIVHKRPDPHGLLALARLDTLERLPAEFITDDLRQRLGDMVWRVRLRPPDSGKEADLRRPVLSPEGAGRPHPPDSRPQADSTSAGDHEALAIGPHHDPEPRWLHLLVMLEFQSRHDWMMAARVQSYAALLWLDLHRRTPFGKTCPPPPLLPIVLYNGDVPWRAPLRMADLLRPVPRPMDAAAGDGTPFAPPGIRGSPLQYAGDGFLLVDQRVLGGEDLPAHNAETLMAWIEHIGDGTLPDGLDQIATRASEWLDGAEDVGLREVLLGWLEAVAEQSGWGRRGGEDMRLPNTSPGRPQGTPEERARRWRLRMQAESRTEGRAEGEALGLARERALLRRQATRKFGVETGDRLAVLLAEAADPDRLAEVGESIIDCEDGAALLERARSLQLG